MDPETSSLITSLRELAPIDLVGLGLVTALFLLGIWRGLWWQVIRLAGLILAVALARVFSPETAVWILEWWTDLSPRVAHGIAWASVFLLTLGAASILGLLGQKILETMQLGLVNRAGGAVAGALTGALVHLTLLVFVCQLAPGAFVTQHVAGTYSDQVLDKVSSQWRVVLGAEAAGEVDRLLGREAPEPGGAAPASSSASGSGARVR